MNAPKPTDRMAPYEVRFWQKVDVSFDGGCWNWLASKYPNGYGQFMVGRLNQPAHRVAYSLVFGDIPEGMQIDHTCHNIACVNPDHLRLVTPSQNLQNRSGATRSSKSGIRGVTFEADRDRWRATVAHNGKAITVGRYAAREEAEEAAIAKRNQLFTHNLKDRLAEASSALNH